MKSLSKAPVKGQDHDLSSDPIRIDPSLIKAADEAMDAMDKLFDSEPATSRRRRTSDPPDPASALAVRLTDGQVFLSLEDLPPSVDLSGRNVVSFLALSDTETIFVKGAVVAGHDDLVARLIGGLPKAG